MERFEKEEIISVLLTTLAGESCFDVTGMVFEPLGHPTLKLLDRLSVEAPELFKDKGFVMDIIRILSEKEHMDSTYDCLFMSMYDLIGQDRMDEYKRRVSEDVCRITKEIAFFLDCLFEEYLDDSLKNDRDVVLAVFEYLAYLAERNGQYLAVPCICSEVPHELLMDDEVFSLLIRTATPATIYTSLLTDKEKLDDNIIFRLTEWYVLNNAFETYGNDDIKKDYMVLLKEWASAVYHAARYPETDWLYGEKDPYTERVFEFKDIACRLFLCELNDPIDPDIMLMRVIHAYEDLMRKKDEEETTDFCWYESFMKLIEPYTRQIRLLSAVTLNDESFFYAVNKVALGEPLDLDDDIAGDGQNDGKPSGALESADADDGDAGFMNIPGWNDDSQIPFS